MKTISSSIGGATSPFRNTGDHKPIRAYSASKHAGLAKKTTTLFTTPSQYGFKAAPRVNLPSMNHARIGRSNVYMSSNTNGTPFIPENSQDGIDKKIIPPS